MDLSRLFRSQLERELDIDRNELHRVLLLPDDSGRVNQLRDLALRLGASTVDSNIGYGDAPQPQLVHNIHMALQTKAMIATVKTTSNYVIVSVFLALIAFASTIATFIAAFR